MSFQTFTAPSLDEAKKAMRTSLGEGAVILATKKREDGVVEIRAIRKGMPLFDGEGPAPAASARPASSLAARGLAKRRPQTPGTIDPKQERGEGAGLNGRIEQSASQSALSKLKGDMDSKLARRDDSFDDPVHLEFHRQLSPQGISDKLIKALAIEAKQSDEHDTAKMLAHALAKTLRFAPLTLSPASPIMLMGQTGAGKTSSAAKLAARAAGIGSRAAFLCADIGRAGALDQMKTYAHALDTRFWPVEDPQGVAAIIQNERPQDILILDAPGVSPFASADIAAMKAYRDALGGEPVLVLPASGDVHEHIDWAKAFSDIGVRRCIITKFDTSRRIGAAVSAAYEANLALAHFSEAPFIADGLIDANPAYLAHRLLLPEPARIGASLQA